MKQFLLFALVVIAAACGPQTPREILQNGNDAFAHPELISDKSPKGKLWRVKVTNQNGREHHIYWFDHSDTVTDNFTVQHGKHTHTETIVVDGKEYVPKNP